MVPRRVKGPPPSSMDWSPQQQHAIKTVEDWLASDRQVCRIFGFAGTGKTTLAQHMTRGLEGQVLFAAYTGKAALRLRQKGCLGASTIHSLIYVPHSQAEQHAKNLLRELENARHEVLAAMTADSRTEPTPAEAERVKELERRLEVAREESSRPSFALNEESEVRDARLVVIDEVSQVGRRMAVDLLSFGVQVLVLGDPAQLPPVGDAGFFINETPDVMLTEVHRQAEGNPIIRMASAIRTGGRIDPAADWGGSKVMARADLTITEAASYDQILVGTNATRNTINDAIRRHRKAQGNLPAPGDKLVCLRNDHEAGLLNGSLWECLEAKEIDGDRLYLRVKSETDELDCIAHRHHFERRRLPSWERSEAQEFDYGYALTVHKAQGSEWPKVLVIDESSVFRQDGRKWMYTAVTRASERVTIAR